jgi:hypothetical protein
MTAIYLFSLESLKDLVVLTSKVERDCSSGGNYGASTAVGREERVLSTLYKILWRSGRRQK